MQKKSGFTLVELLVVLVIIGLLMSLMMPSLNMARNSARQEQSKANMRAIGIAYHQYLEVMPSGQISGTNWPTLFSPYLTTGASNTYVSPADNSPPPSTPLDKYTFYVPGDGVTDPFVPQAGTFCWLGTPADYAEMGISSLPTPDSYVLIFEDWRINSPWDNSVLITPQGDGSLLCKCYGGYASCFYHQVIGPDGNVLITPLNKSSPTWTVPSASKMSYGINNRVAAFGQDGSKLLMVEYGKASAQVVNDPTGQDPNARADLTNTTLDMQDPSQPGVWGGWGASRTYYGNGTTNVLNVDGSVNNVTPASINPTDPSLHDQFWKPSNDPGLSGN